MPLIKRFEDIKAWQGARKLNRKIFRITNKERFNKDTDLRHQLIRASHSIMMNIAEGFGRNSRNEFKQFLTIAHGSTLEVQSSLYIALDQKFISKKEFQELYEFSEDISKMLSSFINYLNKKLAK